MKIWTAEEDAQLLGMLARGVQIETIAESLGRTFKSVEVRMRRKHGINPPNRRTDLWSDDEVALAVELWTSGHSAGEIGKRLGRTRNMVISCMIRRGYRRDIKVARVTSALTNAIKAERSPARKRVANWSISKTPAPADVVLYVPKAHAVPPTAKHWLERAFGECAFPVDGAGVDLVSCCRKGRRTTDGSAAYCEEHRAVMFGAPRSDLEGLERVV